MTRARLYIYARILKANPDAEFTEEMMAELHWSVPDLRRARHAARLAGIDPIPGVAGQEWVDSPEGGAFITGPQFAA